ncbi:hypothetical protein SUNI508_05459 [Seiridium unicorne]|uniref:Uncharacterized protein n=1 Tax=Seiridium unicorne TaxID=138068 RepID=A0ABR2V5G5_9PEZI
MNFRGLFIALAITSLARAAPIDGGVAVREAEGIARSTTPSVHAARQDEEGCIFKLFKLQVEDEDLVDGGRLLALLGDFVRRERRLIFQDADLLVTLSKDIRGN